MIRFKNAVLFIRLILVGGFFALVFLFPLNQRVNVFAKVSSPSPINTQAGSNELLGDVPLRFDHLTIENGLSQNAVLSMLQDSRGYLWIGTQDGLNRYDGYEFKVFKTEPDNPNSLSHNSVLSILEDGQGMLWFGTWGGGLNSYNPATGEFMRYRNDPSNPSSLSNDLVSALHEDRAGRLWVATMGGGLDELDRQSGKFIHHTYNDGDPYSLSSNYISSIVEDIEGRLWLGTGGFGTEGQGLNYFDPQTGKALQYRHDANDPNSLSGDTISSLAQAPDGTLWIGTGGFYLQGSGLNHLDPVSGKVTRFVNKPNNPESLGNDSVVSLYLDPSQVLWIGTWGGGLDRLDLRSDTRKFIHDRHDSFESTSLSSDIIWSILEDRSGVQWLGSINGGLNKLNPQVQDFHLYRNRPQDERSLSFNVVGTFFEDPRGGIWVGTWGGGLDYFDPQTGIFNHYVSYPSDPASLPDNTIGAVLRDQQGTLWVGTFGGLAVMQGDSGEFKIYRHDPDDPSSLADNNISKLIEDHTGRLWIATLGGLDVFDPENEDFLHVKLPPGTQPVAATIDRNGTMWVGTWGQGLFSLDPDSLTADGEVAYSHYQNDPEIATSLRDNSVWAIYEDERGMLWVGTQSGLDRLDRFTDQFIHFSQLDILPNNTILCILGDSHGNLWISTNNGLIQYDPLRDQWHHFEASDGLQSNEFNSGSCLNDSNGMLYFGGVNGFNLFDPLDIQPNPVPPPVVVTDLRIFNDPVQVDLSGKSTIRLDYSQNFIAFDFAALDYHAPARNEYKYMLEGVDKDWVAAGNRRYASYTNLNGGEYTFRVKGANNDGIWNEGGLAIPLRVTPPFWQTWWFQSALVLAAVVVVAGGVGLRFRQVRLQNRHLEAVVEQRTGALRLVNERLEEEIEQRKLAEQELARRSAEELQQAEARFISMYEHAAVGIVITNLERRFLRGNPAIQKMFGYTEAELQSIPVADLTYPEDRNLDVELFRQLAAGERDAYGIEKRYMCKDGGIFWGRLNYSLVRAPDQSPLFAIGIVEDIDLEKQALEALEHSEARFRTMFEHAAVSVAMISLDRRLLDLNPAGERILGYSKEELEDRFTSEVIFPDDVPIDQEKFLELVAGRLDAYQIEKRYIRKDGSVRWGLITHSLVRDPNGQAQFILSMMEDIDEKKRAAEQMAAREAEYRQMLEQTVLVRTSELRETNTRLQQEIEQRQRAEEALSVKAAEDAVAAERTRLARELHDAVTQTLFSASILAEILPELWKNDPADAENTTEELRTLTRGALAEMRTLLLELRPAALTQARLEELLKQLIEALLGRARLPADLVVQGTRHLPGEVQVALYRIAQEALNNIVKYARATLVVIDLQMSPGGVHLEIRDNGVGFDQLKVSPTSLGQRIMRERAENIQADLLVTSVIGKGTTVAVTWNDPEMEDVE